MTLPEILWKRGKELGGGLAFGVKEQKQDRDRNAIELSTDVRLIDNVARCLVTTSIRVFVICAIGSLIEHIASLSLPPCIRC